MSECGKLDIISGRKAVCLCSFHNAVDHRAGLCTGRRVAEQPVLSADSKGTYLVFCTVGGLLLHGVLLAASLYFSDCSQKHIFPWCYFRTLERARERHGFIRWVLLEPLRVMHDDFLIFRTMIRQIEAICYRSATNDDLETQ